MFKALLLATTLLTFSCQRQEYTEASCNQISMKCFKGFPRACNELENQCSKFKIKYTKAVCQQALGELILGQALTTLENKYGQNISGCFTKNDLEKFSK